MTDRPESLRDGLEFAQNGGEALGDHSVSVLGRTRRAPVPHRTDVDRRADRPAHGPVQRLALIGVRQAIATPSARAELRTWPLDPSMVHLVMVDVSMTPTADQVDAWLAAAYAARNPEKHPGAHRRALPGGGQRLPRERVRRRRPARPARTDAHRAAPGRRDRRPVEPLRRVRRRDLPVLAAIDQEAFPAGWRNDARRSQRSPMQHRRLAQSAWPTSARGRAAPPSGLRSRGERERPATSSASPCAPMRRRRGRTPTGRRRRRLADASWREPGTRQHRARQHRRTASSTSGRRSNGSTTNSSSSSTIERAMKRLAAPVARVRADRFRDHCDRPGRRTRQNPPSSTVAARSGWNSSTSPSTSRPTARSSSPIASSATSTPSPTSPHDHHDHHHHHHDHHDAPRPPRRWRRDPASPAGAHRRATIAPPARRHHRPRHDHDDSAIPPPPPAVLTAQVINYEPLDDRTTSRACSDPT